MVVPSSGHTRSPESLPTGPSSVEAPVVENASSEPTYGSDWIVDLLGDLDYRYVPVMPGASFRGLQDSLVNHSRNRRPQTITCLDEGVAVSLAHGYAKATGRACPVIVHDLVGLMNAVMATYNAYCDQAPVVVLGGSGPRDPAMRRPVEWYHTAGTQGALVREFVKWESEPETLTEALSAIAQAHRISSSGPQGPTYVALDSTIQERVPAQAPDLPDLALHRPTLPIPPHRDAVSAAADLLATAARVVVTCGRPGASAETSPLLVELVELIGAAYVDDRDALAFPTAHEYNCNNGPDGRAAVLAEADAVVTIGLTNTPGLLGKNGWPRSIIDISHGDLGARSWSNAFLAPLPRSVHLMSDPLEGVRALIEELRARGRSTNAEAQRARERRQRWARDQGAAAARGRAAAALARHEETPISPARLAAELFAAVADIDWYLLLRGYHTWQHGTWPFPSSGRYLGGSGGGGLGYGPGAAVGGALAAHDRGQLGVGIIGDGDLLMGINALWTAAHYRIPMLLVVNDNHSFFNDEHHQLRVAGWRGRPAANAGIGTHISGPEIDFGAIARGYGCWAEEVVTDPNDLRRACERGLAAALAGRVAVVHAATAQR